MVRRSHSATPVGLRVSRKTISHRPGSEAGRAPGIAGRNSLPHLELTGIKIEPLHEASAGITAQLLDLQECPHLVERTAPPSSTHSQGASSDDQPDAHRPAARDFRRRGQHIGQALAERDVPLVVAEQNREIVERLRRAGIPAVSGDASEAAVLIQGHVARAGMLVIATPDAFAARRMIEIARALNPSIHTVARTLSEDEAALLKSESASRVFMGEHELALAMTRHVLERIEPASPAKRAG